MAIQYKAQIIPYYTINAEYCHPYSYRNDDLNTLVQKLGIPMIPLSPITALVPIAPFLFYLSFPVKMQFIIGKPITVHERFGDRDINSIKRQEIIQLRDELQSDYQKEINRLVGIYGNDPFEVSSLLGELQKKPELAATFSPAAWPFLMTHAYRVFFENQKEIKKFDLPGFLEIMMMNADVLPFITPLLGWPLLFLTKDFKNDLSRKNEKSEKTAGIQKAYFAGEEKERRTKSVKVNIDRRRPLT
jgi:hypothetical protein